MPEEGRRRSIDLLQQYLANERTFLSWLRTSIALIGLGFVIARFGLFLREFRIVIDTEENVGSSVAGNQFEQYSLSSMLGVLMIAIGIALIIYSFKNYIDGNKQIESGDYHPKKGIIYIATILLAIFGGVMVLYLLAVSLL
jgi:putative membrane protein